MEMLTANWDSKFNSVEISNLVNLLSILDQIILIASVIQNCYVTMKSYYYNLILFINISYWSQLAWNKCALMYGCLSWVGRIENRLIKGRTYESCNPPNILINKRINTNFMIPCLCSHVKYQEIVRHYDN